MKKVELLAPAGDFNGLKGAIAAGADAVYIGGKRFGARAYATNFSDEEVCLAIRYAHLFGRKLYLTVNTLMKEEELADLVDYMLPFYDAGLDGVIVQDLGVLLVCKKHFPGLELHASTQMTITDIYGAQILKELGVCRVVPARELSLAEIKTIKEETGLSIEAFIHGAMCYSYSGQCLFSSMLGGRSGNRGRCAQPCRQPYQIMMGQNITEELYPLSLKDMCTIARIPELIQAGIDSFKIEGRMKKPEYVAGVTAMYRKYIDKYYAHPEGSFSVSEKDQQVLNQLYVRSDLMDGYYARHNGKEMITLTKPGYRGNPDAILANIREKYLDKDKAFCISGEFSAKAGSPCALTLTGPKGKRIISMGAEVMGAMNQPLTKESVEKQLCKTGDTPFEFAHLDIHLYGDCFIPVKDLNQLRRDALDKMWNILTDPEPRQEVSSDMAVSSNWDLEAGEHTDRQNDHDIDHPYLAIQVETKEQLYSVLSWQNIGRLYVSDILAKDRDIHDQLVAWKKEAEGRLVYLTMPHILRNYDRSYLSQIKALLTQNDLFDGALARSFDSFYFLYLLKKEGCLKSIHNDASIYVWNSIGRKFWEHIPGVTMTLPYECSHNELTRMGMEGMEYIVYGRIPLMITANCVKKTGYSCDAKDCFQHEEGYRLGLSDRFHTVFPVQTVCRHCYNIIYNSVPLSLHDQAEEILKDHPLGVRVILTTETGDELVRIQKSFEDYLANPVRPRTFEAPFTRGHFRHTVE